jgi:Nbl1 / Borealin N terminal
MAPRTVAIHSPATPERDSARQAPAITVAQKQALIDNLQLESEPISHSYGAPFLTRHTVTERARKLRAQYALHAQGLQSRLEMRINRVPKQLRTTNIAELIDQYSEQLEPSLKRPLPVPQSAVASSKAALNSRIQPIQPSSPARSRGMKRQSSDMAGGSDKENNIDMPKKRTKTTMAGSSEAGPVRATRTASRKVDPSKVLSPKSHNSRQLPQSPFKQPTSPGKSYLARPISPVKPGTVAAATASLASLIAPAEKTTHYAYRVTSWSSSGSSYCYGTTSRATKSWSWPCSKL